MKQQTTVNRRQHLIQLAAGMVALGARIGSAADNANPLRLVIGYTPGGAVDAVARMLVDSLRTSLGRPVLLEHRVGAGQRVALNEIRRTAPDGNTLFIGTLSPFTIYPNIIRKLDYDPVNDFSPVARLATFDACLATGPATGVATIQQLVAWARANPQKAAYGTPGNGTQPHFAGFALGQAMGVPLMHIPYRGGNLAMTDLIGGQIPMMISSLPDMLEMHRAGKLRIVALTASQRSPLVPEVPTLMESGIPFEAENSIVAYGPPLLPDALVKSLNEAVVAAIHSLELKTRMLKLGLTAATSSPKELAKIQQTELQYLGRIIKASGYEATE